MKGIKIGYWLEKHRKKIMFILVLAVVAVIVLVMKYVKINVRVGSIDPTFLGVIGTLLGAVIGGAFTLLGSIWVHNRQQRAVQNVKRKNVIYSPLYDELVNIQNSILKENPYPRYIEYRKGPQTITSHPQYDAWRRIKSDTRYLEVPEYLKNQIEKLEKTIVAYSKVRETVDEVVENIFNEVLVENGQKALTIKYIGSVIAADILLNENIDVYSRAIWDEKENKIDEVKKEKINREVFVRCNENQIVNDVRGRYEEWTKTQEQTIEMLSILIKKVLLKYEV